MKLTRLAHPTLKLGGFVAAAFVPGASTVFRAWAKRAVLWNLDSEDITDVGDSRREDPGCVAVSHDARFGAIGFNNGNASGTLPETAPLTR